MYDWCVYMARLNIYLCAPHHPPLPNALYSGTNQASQGRVGEGGSEYATKGISYHEFHDDFMFDSPKI